MRGQRRGDGELTTADAKRDGAVTAAWALGLGRSSRQIRWSNAIAQSQYRQS